jgi:hypothetical protein
MNSARQAFDEAKPGEDVLGWKLDRAQRSELLSRFPARYAQAVADHVTLKSRVGKTSSLPPEANGTIVGRSDDGRGVEAMVVRIGGSTDRPGGGTYHITWSLAEGRDAKESNDVIAARGWEPVEPPTEVRLQPQLWEKEKP